jgi:hypothetical protein
VLSFSFSFLSSSSSLHACTRLLRRFLPSLIQRFLYVSSPLMHARGLDVLQDFARVLRIRVEHLVLGQIYGHERITLERCCLFKHILVEGVVADLLGTLDDGDELPCLHDEGLSPAGLGQLGLQALDLLGLHERRQLAELRQGPLGRGLVLPLGHLLHGLAPPRAGDPASVGALALALGLCGGHALRGLG